MVALKRLLSEGSVAATATALGPKFFPGKVLLLEVGDTKPFIHACFDSVLSCFSSSLEGQRGIITHFLFIIV